jgi:hypothetical protein
MTVVANSTVRWTILFIFSACPSTRYQSARNESCTAFIFDIDSVVAPTSYRSKLWRNIMADCFRHSSCSVSSLRDDVPRHMANCRADISFPSLMERLQGAHRTCLACARGILIEDGRAVRIPTEGGQKTPRRTRSHVSTRKIEAALSVACPGAAESFSPGTC